MYEVNKIWDKNWKIAIIAIISSILPMIFAPIMIDAWYLSLAFCASFAVWKLISILYRLDTKGEWEKNTLTSILRLVLIILLFQSLISTYIYTGHLFHPTWKWGTETHSAFAWKADTGSVIK